MNKIILGATIILGLGLSNVNAQNKSIKKSETNNKIEKKIDVIGNKFKADFGEFAFELNFENENQLTWRAFNNSSLGAIETVKIQKTENNFRAEKNFKTL